MTSQGYFVKTIGFLIKSKLQLILLVILVLVAFGIEKVTSFGGVNAFRKDDEPSQSETNFHSGNRSQFANFKDCQQKTCESSEDECCKGYECVKSALCQRCKPLKETCNSQEICCGYNKEQNYCKYEKAFDQNGICEKCAKVGESCNPEVDEIESDCCKLSENEVEAKFGNKCTSSDKGWICKKCTMPLGSCKKNEDCCGFDRLSGDVARCIEVQNSEKSCYDPLNIGDVGPTHESLINPFQGKT